MHAVLRTTSLAFGAWLAVSSVCAQSPELPPIFAPRSVVVEHDALPVHRAATSGTISDRMRQLISERVVGEGLADAPASVPAATETRALSVTADGALLMQRFVVKSVGPSQDEVKPPELPLYHFSPSSRVDRRVKPGYTATLLRFLNGAGSVTLGVVNGAGQGVDQNLDFTRVELGFSLRW